MGSPQRLLLPLIPAALTFAMALLLATPSPSAASSRVPPPQATATVTDRAVLFTRVAVPAGWVKDERARGTDAVSFHVALAGANEGVEEKLAAVSDPMGPEYGSWMTPAELRAMFGAPVAVQRRVEAFMASYGASCANLNGASLQCSASAATAADIFATEMHRFTHTASGRRIVRHMGPMSLPAHLKDDVAFVSGLGLFVPPRRKKNGDKADRPLAPVQHTTIPTTTNEGSVCDRNGTGSGADCYVTPNLLRDLYNVSAPTGAATATASAAAVGAAGSIGIVAFTSCFVEHDKNLATFGKEVVFPPMALAVDQHLGVPNKDFPIPCPEVSLDVQYGFSMSPPGVNTSIWNIQGWNYEFSVQLQNATIGTRPDVVSISYDWAEAFLCESDPGIVGHENHTCTDLGIPNDREYVERTNQEYAKLGLLGTTVVVSSGDNGAWSRSDKTCYDNSTFRPEFPSSSPYVLSVGATMLNKGKSKKPKPAICSQPQYQDVPCATGGEEVVCSTDPSAGGAKHTSGGGFSSFSSRPAWQNAAVSPYLQNKSVMAFAGGFAKDGKTALRFNATGRAYPDVSAVGHQLIYIGWQNKDKVEGGTSFSAPIVAGMVAHINAHRRSRGRPTVGFVAPLLYKLHASSGEEESPAFHDIVYGDNHCTESGCLCTEGFRAAPGWDAATGLGTINLGALIDLIDALDERREKQAR